MEEEGGREQGGEREGESKGREVGSDDARQAEVISGGREVEGGLCRERARKGRDVEWTAGGRKQAGRD